MIRVFGCNFSVALDDSKMSQLNMGETYFDQCRVAIQSDLPRERQQQVAIHELVHILLDGEEDRDDINEGFVRRLGNNLYATLVDNDLLRDGWFDAILDNQVSTRR